MVHIYLKTLLLKTATTGMAVICLSATLARQAYKLLTLTNPAIVVTDDGDPIGVLTRQDIISFLSTSSDVIHK